MEELKSCPFCGGKAIIKAGKKEYGFTIWCECSECNAKTEGYCPDMKNESKVVESIENCKSSAMDKWNRRNYA